MAEPERWWIVIARSGSVYPITDPAEAAKWDGKAAQIVGPLVAESSTMAEPEQTGAEEIEHWIGVRIAPGYDLQDFIDVANSVAGMPAVERVEMQSVDPQHSQAAVDEQRLIETFAHTIENRHGTLHGIGSTLREALAEYKRGER